MILDYQAGQIATQYLLLGRFGGASVVDDGPRAITGQGGVTPPPPVQNRIILGLSMVISGLTTLYALTPDLAKGLVEDDYGNIPNRR